MYEIGFNLMNLSFKPRRVGKIIIALIGIYLVAMMTYCLNAVHNDLHKDVAPSTLTNRHGTICHDDCGILDTDASMRHDN